MLEFTVCQMCGKDFIRQPGSIYKFKFAGKTYNFCSYKCYREGVKCKEKTRATTFESTYIKLRKEVEQLKEGDTNV